jgi:hypothetical protein
MSDDSLIPIRDEQAKLLQQIVQAGREAGSYIADILGDLPKDLVGLLVGERVKARRAEKVAILWQQARERLQDRGISPEPPSLKLAIPILQAAVDEGNDQLQDLWSRLLAAAMDPNRRDAVRQSFIQTVKQMDPTDVLVLKTIHVNGGQPWIPNGRDAIATRLTCSREEASSLRST